ncbi:MAG: SLAP domain-containing protein [Brevibacillus sp.]|nr:SLAP domain-containing protein [Brevibacillus sp.]
MFSFIKNWLTKDQNRQRSLDELKQDIQESTTIPAEAAEEEREQVDAASRPTAAAVRKVRTELSLHPSWEAALDAEKKYTLRFLQAELPEMDEGTLGITGFSLIPNEVGMTAAVFFRNGTGQPIRLKNLTLLIMFDDEVFARQSFDLSELGQIPPYSSRPWEIVFPRTSFLTDDIQFERWKVAIQLRRVWPKQLDLDPQMEARMSEEQKDRLHKMVRILPPLSPNEVGATGFDITMAKDGRLVVGVLFRNGMSSPFNPKKLKIEVRDKSGDLVAGGTVDASRVEVKPGTSRPWIIVFPPNAVRKPNADLEKWTLNVK